MDCRDYPNKKCYINTDCGETWLTFTDRFKTKKFYSSNQKVFGEGDLVTGIYIICRGKLEITSNSATKEECIIRFAEPGQVLGHCGLSTNMTYPISAVALTDSESAYIPNESFFKHLKQNVELGFYMPMFFFDELMRSEYKFKLNSLRSNVEKVVIIFCLIICAFKYSEKIKNQINQVLKLNELSNFAVTMKSSFARVIDNQTELKIRTREANDIIIQDEPTQRSLAKMEQ